MPDVQLNIQSLTTTSATTAPAARTSETWTVTALAAGIRTLASGETYALVDATSGATAAQLAEVVRVTAATAGATSITVTRGADATTPVAHSNPCTFNIVVVATALISAGRTAPGPQDYGFNAQSMPTEQCGLTSTPMGIAGTIYGCRVWLPAPATISNLYVHVFTAGAGLTASQCLAALYSSGTLLSATGDQSTVWNGTGRAAMALTTAQTNLAPGYYDICFFFNGTTGPALLRSTAAGTAAFQNGLLTGQALKYFTTADTGRTTTFPATLGAKTATAINSWVAM